MWDRMSDCKIESQLVNFIWGGGDIMREDGLRGRVPGDGVIDQRSLKCDGNENWRLVRRSVSHLCFWFGKEGRKGRRSVREEELYLPGGM